MRYVLAFVFALWPLPGFLLRGERRTTRLGSVLRSAFTRMKGRGTRTPETGTTVAYSSLSLRGRLSVAEAALIYLLRENSSTERSSSIDATATVGGSGEPPEPADCDE